MSDKGSKRRLLYEGLGRNNLPAMRLAKDLVPTDFESPEVLDQPVILTGPKKTVLIERHSRDLVTVISLEASKEAGSNAVRGGTVDLDDALATLKQTSDTPRFFSYQGDDGQDHALEYSKMYGDTGVDVFSWNPKALILGGVERDVSDVFALRQSALVRLIAFAPAVSGGALRGAQVTNTMFAPVSLTLPFKAATKPPSGLLVELGRPGVGGAEKTLFVDPSGRAVDVSRMASGSGHVFRLNTGLFVPGETLDNQLGPLGHETVDSLYIARVAVVNSLDDFDAYGQKAIASGRIMHDPDLDRASVAVSTAGGWDSDGDAIDLRNLGAGRTH